MKNIKLELARPYQRTGEETPVQKVSFEAEFDSEVEALLFQQRLNQLVIDFKTTEANIKAKE